MGRFAEFGEDLYVQLIQLLEGFFFPFVAFTDSLRSEGEKVLSAFEYRSR